MAVIDSFESGFNRWHDEGEVTVPNGWTPDWLQGDGLVRPEFKPETDRVYDGATAAKMCHRFSTWVGVLYRQVPAQLAGPFTMSAYFKAFTTSNPTGALQGRIGVDLHGGPDFRAESVLWSDEWGQWQDERSETDWHQFMVDGIAQASVVTVFLAARVHYAANTSAAFWDKVFIDAAGDVPEPPVPPPPGGEFDWDRYARGLKAFAAVCRGG